MPKIKLYHVRALLWTYLVWALLSVWFAYGFMFCAIVVVGGLSVVASLLKNGRWAGFWVVAGMSLWFLAAFFFLGGSV